MRRRQRAAVAALPLLVAGLLGVTAPPTSAAAPVEVFLNELHYDNSGTDTGEAIEIAGPAGTELTGWSVVLYNGSGGAPYSTVPLAGVLPDQADGFGVISVAVSGIQNGSPDGLALVAPDGAVVQFLSYEGAFTATGGPAQGLTSSGIGVAEGSSTPAGSSLQLTGSGSGYGDFTWSGPSVGSFGAPNSGQRFGAADEQPPPVPPCEVPVTHEIGAVQGTGPVTPVRDRQVTVEGVVVGDFQAADELGGVFLQDADGDRDAASSDGIFVHDPDAPPLAPGEVVRVTGTAGEHFGLTQIAGVTAIGDCGDAVVPAPTALDLPADDATRERQEGMLVSVAEPLTATETYTLARYGELVVSADGRLYTPTNDGGDDAAEQALSDRRRLIIDDGSSVQNPDRVPFTDGGAIRLGDTVTGVQGVLSYGFGAFRLQPTAEPTVHRTNPRPASPDDVGGDLQVASFNVLNYFTTLDEGAARTDTGDDPRGADSAAELERQSAKIVAAILALDAEVVGLMEIENDSDDAALDHLVAALNRAAGEARYAAIEEPDTGDGLFGTDAIKVAMIYRPGAVVPLGAATTTRDEAFDNARLPLAQRFRPAAGGRPFTVVVNHFKSKGCGRPAPVGPNADQGDGQGCFNADRVEQAAALLELVDGLPDKDVLILGDLNAYGEEDPVHVLENAGYVDLVDAGLAEADQYSYVFNGQAGYLDHALASPRLVRRVTGVDIWHINADEPLFLDYNTEFNPPGFYSPDAYRSSDHDPVLVGLSARP